MRFDPFAELDRWSWERLGVGPRRPVLAMDAYRRGDQLEVHLDLPGIDPDSVELTVEKNVLTVTGQRQRPDHEGVQVLLAERPHGEFTRQLFLGEGLDLDGISAAYDLGVLTITVPVAEAAKPRRVEIGRGAGRVQAIEATSEAA